MRKRPPRKLSAARPPIPVTVLTGFLGAGKITLLNRILREANGHRYAVIVEEFGAIGIDAGLIIHAEEEVFELANGCICCSARGYGKTFVFIGHPKPGVNDAAEPRISKNSIKVDDE